MNTHSYLCACAFVGFLLFGAMMQGCGISKNDLCFALVGDLAEYSEANELRLPSDWQSFISWYSKSHKKSRWRKADLTARFSLEWGMDLANVVSNRVDSIHVLDPNLQHLERSLNETFYRHAVGLLAQNQGTDI